MLTGGVFFSSVYYIAGNVAHQRRVRSHQLLQPDPVAVCSSVHCSPAVAALHSAGTTTTDQNQPVDTDNFPGGLCILGGIPHSFPTLEHLYWDHDRFVR